MNRLVIEKLLLEPRAFYLAIFCIAWFIFSIFLDLSSPDQTSWAARSGSVWVLAGVYSAFRNIGDSLDAYLDKLIQNDAQSSFSEFVYENLGKIKRRSIIVELGLVIIGTGIWGYFDIFVS